MADSNSTQSMIKQVSVIYLVEKSPSKVMVTIIFSHQGRRGRRRRRCSDGIEEDEAVGVPGTASDVEEEDGKMAIDGQHGWRWSSVDVEEDDGVGR